MNVKSVIEGIEISIDTNISEYLRQEGVVRDIIREIQSKRKELNLMPSDKISLILKTKENIIAFTDMIKSSVNSDKLDIIKSESEEIFVTKI